MKRSLEETREKFNRVVDEYDDTRGEEHHRAVEEVIRFAREILKPTDTVVDLGAGTGMVSLELAPYVERVIALDVSERMLEELERKAGEAGLENIETGIGRFREPEANRSIDGADVIVSNYAMHHLNGREKQEAIDQMRALLEDGDRSEGYVVLGDVILFEEVDDPEGHFDPEVDDPSTIEDLRTWFNERGFAIVHEEKISPSTGVLGLQFTGGTTGSGGA
jgi:cyclopropane fatty-acyl-phospholipid synthase-like methyltransferase